MKSLYININGEDIQSSDEVYVVGKSEDAIVNKFYYELGKEILKGVDASVSRGINKKGIVTTFMDYNKECYYAIWKEWETVKDKLLGENPAGTLSVTLPTEYISWLNNSSQTSYSEIAKILHNKGGVVEVSIDKIYRNAIGIIINSIEPSECNDCKQFVVNDSSVTDDSAISLAIMEKLKGIGFVPFDDYDKCPLCGNRPCVCEEGGEKDDKCPMCGKNPCECSSSQTFSEELYIVSDEANLDDGKGNFTSSYLNHRWGLYNQQGQMCLPIAKYELLSNNNYPECFRHCYSWYKGEKQNYYYLSEYKCIYLGAFTEAIPLNDDYIAVKKTEGTPFCRILDKEGNEVISEGKIGNVKGINKDGWLVCELSPNKWGLLNIKTQEEFSFGKNLCGWEINPDLSDIYVKLCTKGVRNSGEDYFISFYDGPEMERIEYEDFDYEDFSFNRVNDIDSNFIIGDCFYDTINQSIEEFEGIRSDIAYRCFRVSNQNDFGFCYLPTADIYNQQVVLFKINDYCIVSEKDPNFKKSRRIEKYGLIDLAARREILGIEYDGIYYLSKATEDPSFVLVKNCENVSVFDPKKGIVARYEISGKVLEVLFQNGVINIYYDIPGPKGALLILDALGKLVYHDKWGQRDLDEMDNEANEYSILPDCYTFENGKLRVLDYKYNLIWKDSGKGVQDSEGNAIVPFKYESLGIFKPFMSYCKERDVILFEQMYDDIKHFLL